MRMRDAPRRTTAPHNHAPHKYVDEIMRLSLCVYGELICVFFASLSRLSTTRTHFTVYVHDLLSSAVWRIAFVFFFLLFFRQCRNMRRPTTLPHRRRHLCTDISNTESSSLQRINPPTCSSCNMAQDTQHNIEHNIRMLIGFVVHETAMDSSPSISADTIFSDYKFTFSYQTVIRITKPAKFTNPQRASEMRVLS